VRRAIRVSYGIRVPGTALLAWTLFLLAPGVAQAQELNNKNKELNIDSQPESVVQSVEVGSGSGTSHTVTVLSVVSRQPGDSTASNSTTIEEQSAFAGALKLLQEKRYLDAAQRFVGFLREYSNSALADEAWYWLGESRYLDRGFDDAVTAMTTLLEYFPESALAGAARLKLGYSYNELRQYQKARATLNRVLEDFPDDETAVLAKVLLGQMDAEGH